MTENLTTAPAAAEVTNELPQESNLESTQSPQAEAADPSAAPEASSTDAKIKIGDQIFATQAEALAYANKLVEDQRIADAYSQGVRDAASQAAPVTNVTPPAPERPKFDAEKYYANPEQYMAEFEQQILDKAVTTIEQKNALKAQNDRLWSEFCDRHPEFTEFRRDVETIAQENSAPLQAVVAVKGLTGGYDYLANKLKDKFMKQTEALKPRKALSNAGGGASPTSSTSSVTPKKTESRPLTFAEQVRQHKLGKR